MAFAELAQTVTKTTATRSATDKTLGIMAADLLPRLSARRCKTVQLLSPTLDLYAAASSATSKGSCAVSSR
jgi:hypothetical protein